MRRHEFLQRTGSAGAAKAVSRIATPGELGPALTIEVIGDGRPHDNKRRRALELRKIDLLIEQETYAPFDALRGRPLRARLLRLHADDHVLC